MKMITDPLASQRLSKGEAKGQAERLVAIPYYPADGNVKADVCLLLIDLCVGRRIDQRGAFCGPVEQADAVITRAVRYLRRWEGLQELTAIHKELFPRLKATR